MQSEGLCDKVAKYYIEWSWELERLNSFKKAEQTFNLALAKIDNPADREVIEIKHKQFQARVMKRMLEKSGDDEVFEAQEEQRTVLSSLRGQGKVNTVQEACAKCFAVHLLKFEILQTIRKNKNLKMLNLLVKN